MRSERSRFFIQLSVQQVCTQPSHLQLHTLTGSSCPYNEGLVALLVALRLNTHTNGFMFAFTEIMRPVSPSTSIMTKM